MGVVQLRPSARSRGGSNQELRNYRRRLLQLERQLGARLQRELTLGRDQVRDISRDAADESVSDEAANEDFTAGELDAAVLQQVEAALKRIDNGTFGQCTVDGRSDRAETARCDTVDAGPLEA